MSARSIAALSATGTLKVLHVYRTYFPDPPGGVQEAIRQICLATAQGGVRSTVFCLSPRPVPARLEAAEAAVWRARSWAAPASCDLGGVGALRRFARLAREHDVVHYHFPWPFADLMHLATRVPARTVMTYHSDIVRQSTLGRLYAPLMRRMLARMDRIVATSPNYARSSAVLSDPAIAPRVRVIPLGIADFSGAAPAEADAHGPDDDDDDDDHRPYFLFLGALRYYKGLSTLVEAAGSIKARIVIAGQGPEGAALKRQAAALGHDNITFLGPVGNERKSALLKGCRALVMPSNQRSEAFGMALVEAAMFARPMVSTDLSTGTTYVNEHGTTGLVVPPDDAAALADALNTLLADPVLAERFGVNARKRYCAHFSGSALGIAYNRLYREVLAA